jgi:hypothetical protein
VGEPGRRPLRAYVTMLTVQVAVFTSGDAVIASDADGQRYGRTSGAQKSTPIWECAKPPAYVM